ncbi:activated Cdc42 kinase-like isoform X2 [Schistocerca gregaria]|uniref:activated Cdc42 kinase-like isoform X2 n=1 Tax=Schistocerca gregaria TaxID=7010 RepID=UPI00211E4584|nr:activated Cdc42 kinase-like isoform X2 [Schistocerca gregaria]
MTTAKGPGLYEFLIEAELQQYYAGIKNDLKVQNVPQLKYVTEDDLHSIGMSRPEVRRLNKYFQKHFPQNYLSKLKKMILPGSRRGDEQQVASMVAMLPDEGPDKPAVRVPNKHIIPAEAIIVNKELGSGEFGVVQQGVWTNDGERIQVAIKCLSRERMQNNPIEFLKEAGIMHSIDHEHIVRLYGVVLDTGALMLVTELAPLRSLLECLKEPSLRPSFPVLTLCDFAVQICDGMQYLEAKRLIHRDLAARNILVFSKNKVKISDFGLSRALGVGKDYYQTNFNVNLKLPIAWCAPECISYLRFTSASDVWAYGVTLWEIFSYGFQPWAALTGHQILEAIDEPNFQRLEQPDCCPKEYFNVMLKCWQHDPGKRPRFADLMELLPECKPEQVQAVQDCCEEPAKAKREQLLYRVGDVITVLDKGPIPNVSGCWKGVLNSGKTGLFNPAHTVAYLGSNLPAAPGGKPGEFVRGDSVRSLRSSTSGKMSDGKNPYSSRRRLRPEMISRPQGDLKHTGHVGLDGSYFGDMSFLGGKQYQHLPHQVVAPYKPQEDSEPAGRAPGQDQSDRAPLLKPVPQKMADCDVAPKSKVQLVTDHEYHEISDEESLPPPADSPCFEKSFDLGPSLLDEMESMIRGLGSSGSGAGSGASTPPPPSPLDETTNVRNELREIAAKVTSTTGRKKQATVKPISASDEKTLDSAIAMAHELAARSMSELDSGGVAGGGGGPRTGSGVGSMQGSPPESPHTPAGGRRKFSFRFPAPSASSLSGGGGGDGGGTGTTGRGRRHEVRRTFSEEAASIPDIQVPSEQSSSDDSKSKDSEHSSLTEEARAAYTTLVEAPAAAVTVPVPGVATAVSSDAGSNPLRLLRSGPLPVAVRRPRGAQQLQPLPAPRALGAPPPPPVQGRPRSRELQTGSEDEGPSPSPTSSDGANPIPLPPRDRSRPPAPSKPRHQRKHPLIIPGGGVSRTLARLGSVDSDEGADDRDRLSPQLQRRGHSPPPRLDEAEEEEGGETSEPPRNGQVAAETTADADRTGSPCDGDDSFERHIADELEALDAMEEEPGVGAGAGPRPDGHAVSCEDLLEFASPRTAGPRRGADSDEVRIMRKVLGPEAAGPAELCVSALEAAGWDVHRAIKLRRLHTLLLHHRGGGGEGEEPCDETALRSALEGAGWDVARALLALQAQGTLLPPAIQV